MRKARVLALLLVLACVALAADITQQPKRFPFQFVVYGDIRFTAPSHSETSDPVRRELIVQKIAQEKPSFVVVTGDLVWHGSDDKDWEQFDSGTKPLRDAGILIYPVLGNHDLSGDSEATHYLGHFPQIQRKRWYTLQYGNCYFFLLDSSRDRQDDEQWQWLENGLQQIPKDAKFVFFVMHHPPVTQSSDHLLGGGHSARDQEKKLGDLVEQAHAKTGLPMFVLAGHVHNYERYERGGVMYIVTGGGGATPYEIKRNPDDFYRDAGPTYHFTEWTVDKNKLSFKMYKLEMKAANQAEWTVRDSFQVNAK